MALIRIAAQPPRRYPALPAPTRREITVVQPEDWPQILCEAPGPRSAWPGQITAFAAVLFSAGLLFSACVILIQPFFLLFYSSRYPNLASVSFTSISLAVLGLSLSVLLSLMVILRPWLRMLSMAIKVIIGIAVAGVMFAFFLLLTHEILLWILTNAGIQRILNAFS